MPRTKNELLLPIDPSLLFVKLPRQVALDGWVRDNAETMHEAQKMFGGVYVALFDMSDVGEGCSVEIEGVPESKIIATWLAAAQHNNIATYTYERIKSLIRALGVHVYEDRDEWESQEERS